jgi:hypothetical protein
MQSLAHQLSRGPPNGPDCFCSWPDSIDLGRREESLANRVHRSRRQRIRKGGIDSALSTLAAH